jgi:hypothetical protein
MTDRLRHCAVVEIIQERQRSKTNAPSRHRSGYETQCDKIRQVKETDWGVIQINSEGLLPQDQQPKNADSRAVCIRLMGKISRPCVGSETTRLWI